MKELNAILTIAYRDLLKFLRDRTRIVSTFILPLLLIGILGGSLESNLGQSAQYSLLTFTFVGVLAQTLFQSSASGVISLVEDRESDFSQEIFVSPISRYSIVFGKILGESLVAIAQGVGILLFGLVIGIDMSLVQILALVPVSVVVCLFGGAFGVMVLSNLGSQRSAQQIFPFLILPQFFLAGVFAPVKELPLYLDVLSHLAPMRYAVDLTRSVYYRGTDEYEAVVLMSAIFNIIVIAALFTVFMVVGTFLFVRLERNR